MTLQKPAFKSVYTTCKEQGIGHTKNEELSARYPTKRGRDWGDRVRMGDLVAALAVSARAYLAEGSSTAEAAFVEHLDREFLFGCWGDVMREVVDYEFTRDIRGIILAMFRAGFEMGGCD